MEDEQCPKCGAVFPADRAWAHRTVTGFLLYRGLEDLDTRVRCPSCSKVFDAKEYRFFGIVPPHAMRIGMVMFILAMVLASLCFLVFGSASAFAQPPQIDISGWKVYRNETMGFETRYPGTWRVRSVQGTGPETVLLSETPHVGKPQLAVQFWVQRKINPSGLPIEQWYADQLRRMNAAPPPTTNTSIGGRSAVRMEAAGASGRQFQFFTSLNKTDIFEITVKQPSSQVQLDPTYQKLISTLRFIH
jgi:uncharacterized C2H2 Zn-finger protein